MQRNVSVYVNLLRGCKSLAEAKRIHEQVMNSNNSISSSNTTFLSNLLIQMYGRLGSVQDARSAFDSTPCLNIYSWGLMMNAYAQNGHCERAVQLYWEMSNCGIKAENGVVFVTLLTACSKMGSLECGQAIHSHVVEAGFYSDALHGALINLYGRCGRPLDARLVFDRVPTRNVVAWSTMIAAYARNGHNTEALELFGRMVEESLKPNQVAYTSAVEACASSSDLQQGRKIHSQIVSEGVEVDAALGNALINMYAKCKSWDEAWGVFSGMRERNIFSWNCMISAFLQNGQDWKALRLYQKMEPEGVKGNTVTYVAALSACSALGQLAEGKKIHTRVVAAGYDCQVIVRNTLLNMYAKCGKVEDARKVFDETVEKTQVSWNSMMAAYAQNGHPRKTLELYRCMNVEPDCITITTVLDACSRLRALDQGKEIHEQFVRRGFKPDTATGNALITMYGRCDSLDNARAVFEGMESRDIVTWTAIITAYAQNGYGKEALEVYQQMKALGTLKPNEITLISVVDACCIAKDLAEGRLVHSRINKSHHRLRGPLGNALVNMYTNCGSLVEARAVFDEMQERDIICWSSLIAGYAQHGHGPEALYLLLHLCLEGLQPDHITFITILFACSHAGLVAEGRHVFLLMCGDYSICPELQHYECFVDILGRAGWLREAEDLVSAMPFEPDSAWMTLLGSYNATGDYRRGLQAVELAYTQRLMNHRKRTQY